MPREVAAGGLEYHRINFNQQFYWPLSTTFTLLWNVDLGYARGTGGKPLPFFKNYYAGGPGTVRGFEDFSLGPRDAENNTLGGTRRVVTNLERRYRELAADERIKIVCSSRPSTAATVR